MSISGRIQHLDGIDALLEDVGMCLDECNQSDKEVPDYHKVEGAEAPSGHMHS